MNPETNNVPRESLSGKLIVIFVAVGVLACIAFVVWGFYLIKQKEMSNVSSAQTTLAIKETRNNQNNNMNTSATEKISFPMADYKDFASSDNTDSLDPKIAMPKITEYGMQHLEIVERNAGYATVGANLLASKLNVPLGWESRGGFDPFDKIFFYPKGANSKEDLPLPYIALKILDSKALGTSDLDAVMQKVTNMMKESKDPAFKNMLVVSDLDKNVFTYEVRGVKHIVTGELLGVMDIYMKDPTPNSTLFADLQLSVLDKDFEKYKGLQGLIYKSLQIDWKELARVIEQTR